MRWFPLSAMKTFPEPSAATSKGPLSWALVAGPIPASAIRPIPCHGLNNPRGRDHLPDTGIASVRNEDVSRDVDEHAAGGDKFSVWGRTAVPTEAKVSISCHGVNNPGGGHDFPNALIARIRNKDVPRAVTEHTAGAMEFCTSGRAAVPAESKVSISCHGVNNP